MDAAAGVGSWTREQLWVAKMVGVSEVVVALTKADLIANPDVLGRVEQQTRALFAELGYPAAQVPVVRVSARAALAGELVGVVGVGQLLDAIDSWVPTPPRPVEGALRMPIKGVLAAQGEPPRVVGWVALLH